VELTAFERRLMPIIAEELPALAEEFERLQRAKSAVDVRIREFTAWLSELRAHARRVAGTMAVDGWTKEDVVGLLEKVDTDAGFLSRDYWLAVHVCWLASVVPFGADPAYPVLPDTELCWALFETLEDYQDARRAAGLIR
jgi:hypothetical protein